MQSIDTILQLLSEDSYIKTVLYESPYSANLKIDRKPSPYAICYLVQSFDVDVIGNRFFRSLSVEVFFCEPTDLSADGYKVQAVCDNMLLRAQDFIHRLKDTHLFEFEKVTMRQAVGRFDKNVTGIVCELDLKERFPVCFSELPEPTDTLSDLT